MRASVATQMILLIKGEEEKGVWNEASQASKRLPRLHALPGFGTVGLETIAQRSR